MLKLLSNNFYRLSGGSVTLLALLILASFIVFFPAFPSGSCRGHRWKGGHPQGCCGT